MPRRYHTNDHYLTSVNLGYIEGVRTDSMSGYNNALPADVETTIWPFGGSYVWPDRTGEAMEIVSDNAADVGVVVQIQGLDGNGEMVNDLVVVDGLTPVPTNATFGRVNFMLVINEPGCIGVLRLQGAGGGPVYSGVQPLDQQSQQLIYTIPSTEVGFFLPAESTLNRPGGGGGGVATSLGVLIRRPGGPFWRAGRWGLQREGASAFLFETAEHPALTPWIDIIVTGTATAPGVDISGRVPFELKRI
jgi:hypothetical protein